MSWFRCVSCVQSKALRERWLLDGPPAAGPEQDEVKRQLEQDEAKARSLEETICRSDSIQFIYKAPNPNICLSRFGGGGGEGTGPKCRHGPRDKLKGFIVEK